MKGTKAFYLKVAVTLLFIAAVVFIIFLFSSIVRYRNNIYETAEEKAQLYALDSWNTVRELLDFEQNQAQQLASDAADAESHEAFTALLRNYIKTDSETITVRYFKDGTEYDYDGSVFTYAAEESPKILDIIRRKGTGYVGLLSNAGGQESSCIAFVVNTVDSDYADTLLVLCSGFVVFENWQEIADTEIKNTNTVYYALCGSTGNSGGDSILYKSTDNTLNIGKSQNFFNYFYELTNDAEGLRTLENGYINGKNTVVLSTIDGVRYLVMLGTSAENRSGVFTAKIIPADGLVSYEYSFMSRITGAGIAFLVVMLMLLICFLSIRAFYSTKMNYAENVDPVVGCNTYRRFCAEADEIISIHQSAKYALIYFELNNYKFITQNLGSNAEIEVLKYTGKVLGKCISDNETYGRISDGNFVVLMHYLDEKNLTDKIRFINAIITNYSGLKERQFSLGFYAGVYPIDKSKKIKLDSMLDNAVFAQRTKNQMQNICYNFYDNNIDKKRQREQEIEARKETALKNNEFKVFFQPKYSIENDRIEGAEALVRWYNPQKNVYYQPSAFLSIFENDSFIVELDHFVYVTVCRYMKDCVDNGKRVFPISVNVSRYTAMQPGFLEFMVSNKKKYGIADRFLMVEFTESFAYENYDSLRSIVIQLRQNGLLCSIDDFGSGYSSYNILKELPMDELKLDRFFILPGINNERDDHLLYSIIQLGKRLGMKITQEGVESSEDMKRLKTMGCDTVQGFYYALPMPMEDYDRFVENECKRNG